jgi:hypothetical protein
MGAVELRDEPEITRKCRRGNCRADERLHGDAHETADGIGDFVSNIAMVTPLSGANRG